VVALTVRFEEGLPVVVEATGVSREPVEIGVSPTGIDRIPVDIGVSRGGSDILPVTVEREGSVMSETTVSDTGGTLVMLPVKPSTVSITALEVERLCCLHDAGVVHGGIRQST
jgi:hypothetical protein